MNESDQSKAHDSADVATLRERVARLEQQHLGQVAELQDDAQLLAEAATEWLELPSEQKIYESLARNLQRIVGDDVIISVSDLGEHTAHISPKVIVGLGPLIEKASSLLGSRPIDMAGSFPATVRAAMATGRVVRIDGGVPELAGEFVPPSICREVVHLMGLADVFVVGFAWGRFAGGICFVARRPNMILRQGTIEALVRVVAATIERKRSAELAQLQAIKLDLALSAAEIGAWELDLVTDKRHFDARVCGLLGIERATFGGTKEEFYRAVHPEDQEGLCVALRRTIDEGTAYAVEYRAVWPDGSVHWLSGRGTRLYDAEGRPTVINGFLWDITARKLADEILRESEDRFRHLFEHSTIGMAITQLTGEITVNRAYRAMLGYDLGGLDKTLLRSITHPDDTALTAREFGAVLAGEKPFARFEKRYLNKNGSLVWVDMAITMRRDAAGKPLYVMTSVVDITQRKLAEQGVRRANAFLDSIVENIPNMLILKDARELRFVSINRAGEELLGHSKSDLIGKNDYDFFPQQQADFFTQKDREVLHGGKVVDIPEEPLQTKTNGQRTLHTKKVPIPGPTGEPEYLLGISEDITERKLAEQANLEQMHELRRWHELTLGRETRIIELKREVNELLAKVGQPVRYTTAEGREPNE